MRCWARWSLDLGRGILRWGNAGDVLFGKPAILELLGDDQKPFSHSFVTTFDFRRAAVPDEALQLLISAKPQHFFTAAHLFLPHGGENDGKKGFELECLVTKEYDNQFLHEDIWETAG